MDTDAKKTASKLAKGHAMLEQLARRMDIALLAWMVSLAASARRSATLRAKVARSMEVSSTASALMIVPHAQVRSRRC